MRLLLVTDAWHPQINGVVRTLTQMRDQLSTQGWDVRVLGPSGLTLACPTYPEIRLTLNPYAHIRTTLKEWQPHAVHIATEGPLGWAMRDVCISLKWPFTTSFHTRFPEYLKSRFHLPLRWTYKFLSHFHRPAERVLVPTPSVARDLWKSAHLSHTEVWGRGVDTVLFQPDGAAAAEIRKKHNILGPLQLCVGRLAIEKNLRAFLEVKNEGTKVIIGDGPMRGALEREFPQALFLGSKTGKELSRYFAAADVFVFPSLTDTFGLVMLEALASGTPVAALPSGAARDVLRSENVATIDSDLKSAITTSLGLSRLDCRKFAIEHSWSKCAKRFADALAFIPEVVDLDQHLRPSRSGLSTAHFQPWMTIHGTFPA